MRLGGATWNAGCNSAEWRHLVLRLIGSSGVTKCAASNRVKWRHLV
jgi:hypothetical protein